jgi:hypothetical protein
MAGPEPVNTVIWPGPGAMDIVRKTFIQADMPRVKVFFLLAMNRFQATVLLCLPLNRVVSPHGLTPVLDASILS